MLEALFKMVNKSTIVRRNRRKSSGIPHQYEEDFDDENSIWMKVLHLTSQNLWMYTVILMSLSSILIASINACGAFIDRNSPVVMYDWFYLCDICWTLDIVLRFVSRYVPKIKTRSVILKQPHIIKYIIDVLSIIPFEQFFIDNYLGRVVMINRWLKLVHTFFLFQHFNYGYRISIKLKILQLMYILVAEMCIISAIISFFICDQNKKCGRNSGYGISCIFSVVIGYLTGRGSDELYIQSDKRLTILLVVYTCYMGVVGWYQSEIIFVLRASYAQKGTFKTTLQALNEFFDQRRCYKEFLEYANTFFDNMWKVCGGYQGLMAETSVRMEDFEAIIPKSMFVDIHLDVYFKAFAHSLLFKDADITYIRELSRQMKLQVFTSEQFVFHRNITKQAMVYVFSGVIDVITEEDGDSTVISFSDGTCLGEISLMFPYKSRYKVRCTRTCILHILSRKDFLKVSLKYPIYYKHILKSAKYRFEIAHILHKTKEFIHENRNSRILSEEWLGNILHYLMGLKSPNNAKLHELENIYLQYKHNSINFKNCLVTAKYLSLMAIKERNQSYSDTLFMKSTFLHIFRPNTGLTLCWDIFVGIFSLFAGIYVPYESLVFEKYKDLNYPIILLFTVIWWLDIFVKLRTAVQLKHRLIMKPLDILLHRISHTSFILDILSAIPLELLSGTLVTEDISSSLYINRVLKLTCAFQLLTRWEQRYNSNVIIIRLLYVWLFLVYSSFLVGITYSAIDCLRGCTEYELNRLIFFATQGITGLDITVEGYSENDNFDTYNILVYLIICTLIIYLFALLFSAFVGSRFIKLKIQYENKKLIIVAKQLNVELVARVESYLQMQALVYSDDPGRHFLNIPKPMLGHWFNKVYVDSLLELPIFKGCKRYVVVEILQSASRLEEVEAGSVLYRVGDFLEHFVVIMSGSCELISGVDYRTELITEVRALNDIEVFLSLPSRNCVRTNACAEIFYINYGRYEEVLKGFGFRFKKFSRLRKQVQVITLNQAEFQNNNNQRTLVGSFFKHKGDEYFHIFKNNFQRSFFLPFTINPYSKFAVYYEIFRSTCGLISAFMYTTTGLIFFPISHYISILLIILDIISVMDIYIRMHYCFYDKDGIMITHPLKTAKYYIRHGMLPDLIGALPIHWVMTSYTFFLLNATRLFQIHRYIGLLRFFRNNSITPLKYLHRLTFLPIMLVFINYLVSIYMICKCSMDEKHIFSSSPICISGTILDGILFSYEFTAVSAHFYVFYVLISLFTGIGMQGFRIGEIATMFFFAMISFTAILLSGLITGTFFDFFFCEDMDILHKEIRYNQLCKFIKDEKVKPKLLKHVDRHLKRYHLVEPLNVHIISHKLPDSIIRDMLYVRFKSLIVTCLICTDDFIPFIRNLLMQTNYEVIECNGFIFNINDVTDQTLIIFSGIVEKIEPDGTVVEELKPGSILGNLSLSKYKRITNSFIASTTTEILSVDSLKFAKILDHFPQTKRLFVKLRSKYSTHIPGFSTFERKVPKHKTVGKKKSHIFKIINLIFFIIGAYLSQVIYLYQFSLISCSFTILILNLFCDICFIIDVTQTVIVPTYKQNKTSNWKVIFVVLFTNKIFIFSLVSVIPVHYFMYVIYIAYNPICNLAVTLRSPVLLRIIYLKYYIRVQYMGKRFYCQLVYAIIIVSLILLYNSAILHRLLESEKHMHGINLNFKNFEEFSEWFHVIVSMFTRSCADFIYPATIYSAILILISILCAMYAQLFLYASIISLLNAAYQVKWNYLVTIDKLLYFMNKFEVSLPMIEAVSTYSNLAWNKRDGYKMPELLNELPAYLKQSILFEAVGYVIDCHPLFAKCHKDMRRQLISKLKMEFYFHADHIQYAKVADNTMYCVHYGDVLGLVTNLKGNEHCDSHFTAGDYFGIRQGICRNQGHTKSYKVQVEACIVYLELDSWEYLMDFFPASKNIIFEEVKKFE